MTWLLFVFFIAASDGLPSSFTPAFAFSTEAGCERQASALDLGRIRRIVRDPTVHHFEARCLGFKTPKPGADA